MVHYWYPLHRVSLRCRTFLSCCQVAAARLIEPHVDAVDLNLGCPQTVAEREHFGAFLMDDLPRIRDMVATLATSITVPVTCKIRRFPDPLQTVAYARMLVDAGCQMLAVHPRLREQKGASCSLADWDVIKYGRALAHAGCVYRWSLCERGPERGDGAAARVRSEPG